MVYRTIALNDNSRAGAFYKLVHSGERRDENVSFHHMASELIYRGYHNFLETCPENRAIFEGSFTLGLNNFFICGFVPLCKVWI